MTFRRRDVLTSATIAGLAAACPARAVGAAEKPEADLKSLARAFRVPDWFRDAKLGLWAHWGPQCVPEAGDWYGRQMYIQGNAFYKTHIEKYGHPSKTGFLDIIGKWKAENWRPEELIPLYKDAGAKYFVAMAQHHDNFDNYDSSFHSWNSVKVGPKRDIVGTWAKLARAAGLKFGVSNHGSHAWHWWQTAYGYDAEGPYKGIRYDAARLRKADGAGTWWDGLDPQLLYTGARLAPPDGISTMKAMEEWNQKNSGGWPEELPAGTSTFFSDQWLARSRDLVAKYKPDLLYFDDTGIPFGKTGLAAVADLYRQSIEQHGQLEAVVTSKLLSDDQRRALVEDVERGYSDRLRPEPWQTDTCIGDWHYNRARFEQHYYTPAKAVIQRLMDVVSKNGNLLLSIPMRGDGSIDSDERRIVEEIGAWTKAYGEGLYGSRPWKIFGEGPTVPPKGSNNEYQLRPYTAQDIRFTTRAGALYAAILEWPADGLVKIQSLAKGARHSPGGIDSVELVGGGPLTFRQTADALELTLPGQRPVDFVPLIRIRGRGLVESA